MSTPFFAATMLAAGIGIPVLAALNGGLGRAIGSPSGAAVILFSVALCLSLLLLVATGPAALARVPEAPRHLLLGGVFIAFYVVSITAIAPRFGVGNAVFFVLVGQVLSTAVIDHFGLFGSPQTPVTGQRLAGLALMVSGVALTQRGGWS